MKKLIVLFLVGANPGVFAETPPGLPCAETDTQCAHAEALKSPTSKKSFWSSAMAKPVAERIALAPPELVTYMNLDNISSDIPNRPHVKAIDEQLLNDIRAAFADIPASIKTLADKKLAGIYLLHDLGGTAYTDYANGGWFSRDAGFIVLDVGVLEKQTANAWATWKENTPFKTDPTFRLDAMIETNDNNNRKNAIQYIMLHELAHVLSIGEKFHPRWDGPPSSVKGFPFSEFSWQFAPDVTSNPPGYTSRFEPQFPLRREVVYYFGARLGANQMNETYTQLAATNFPTLYAATRPGDDFAESFVSYVHTVMMKRPWEIRLFHNNQLVRTIPACWEEKRCAEKRRLLEDFLGVAAR